MNEKELINKLSPLKEVTPSSKRVKRMRVSILMEIEGKSKKKFLQHDNYKSILRPQYFMIPVLLLVIGVFSLPLIQKQTQPLLYATRIALTDNHYEKTKLAFEEAQMQFDTINHSQISSYHEVMATTGTTNQYISHLHLQGEMGKYTAKQCELLYQQYALYLSMLKSRLQQQKQQNYVAQIVHYQEQAKSRLAYYKRYM